MASKNTPKKTSPKPSHISIGTLLSISKIYSNIENALEAMLQDFENSIYKIFVFQPA